MGMGDKTIVGVGYDTLAQLVATGVVAPNQLRNDVCTAQSDRDVFELTVPAQGSYPEVIIRCHPKWNGGIHQGRSIVH
jgi:hypothetical protein